MAPHYPSHIRVQDQQQDPPPDYYQADHQQYHTAQSHSHPPQAHTRGTREIVPHCYAGWTFHFFRQILILIPIIVFIIDVWRYADGGVCDAFYYGPHPRCYWILYLTLPIAAASFIWAVVIAISLRREQYHRPGIPLPLQLAVQPILALGSVVCFALLIYLLTSSDAVSISLAGGMTAALALITIANVGLWMWYIYIWNLMMKSRRRAAEEFPI